jgi:hypothetical protein
VDDLNQPQVSLEHSARTWRPSGPVIVGICFATVAILLTLFGLWREDNLSLRNVLLGAALGGGTWGVISWAIASTVIQVEHEVASRDNSDN